MIWAHYFKILSYCSIYGIIKSHPRPSLSLSHHWNVINYVRTCPAYYAQWESTIAPLYDKLCLPFMFHCKNYYISISLHQLAEYFNIFLSFGFPKSIPIITLQWSTLVIQQLHHRVTKSTHWLSWIWGL